MKGVLTTFLIFCHSSKALDLILYCSSCFIQSKQALVEPENMKVKRIDHNNIIFQNNLSLNTLQIFKYTDARKLRYRWNSGCSCFILHFWIHKMCMLQFYFMLSLVKDCFLFTLEIQIISVMETGFLLSHYLFSVIFELTWIASKRNFGT